MSAATEVQGGSPPEREAMQSADAHADNPVAELSHSEIPPSPNAGPGFIGRIPVRNLWLLVLYASDLYRSGDIAPGSWDDDDVELPDLLAKMLVTTLDARLQRPLTRGYAPTTGPLRRVRGRIDAWETERGAHWPRGQVVCQWHEHSLDTPRHRLVLCALLSLARLVRDRSIRARCQTQATALQHFGVQRVPVDPRAANQETFGRHDAHDRPMVQLAQLALSLLLPSEAAGPVPLPSPEREDAWVRRLFEKAVLGFYRAHLPTGWIVRAEEKLDWPLDNASPGMRTWLPGMRLDLSVESPIGHRLVIDTKFTTLLRRGHYEKEQFASAHLYQLYAYLRTQSAQGDPTRDHAHGLLLYPSIGVDHLEWMTLQGHRMTLATVDLASTPSKMRGDLMRVVSAPEAEGPQR